mgnify:CR=1 FL=1
MLKELKKAVKTIKKAAKSVWKGVKRVMKEVKNLVTNETNERIKEDLYEKTVEEWGPEKLVEVALLTIGGAFVGAVVSALCGIKMIPNKERIDCDVEGD